MHKRLAQQIRGEINSLVDRYDTRLRVIPGYAELTEPERHSLERRVLDLMANCLETDNDQLLIDYIHERARQVLASGFDPEWFQQAVAVLEEIVTPLVTTVAESNFAWRTLNRAQETTWHFVAEERKRLEHEFQESLERRGRQVQTSTEVSQDIAAAPDLNELFQRVVTLIKERFGYYHAQIFRYDSNYDAMVLVSGYGTAGERMLAEGHKLQMGRGVVGTAAANGKSILATDAAQDEDWRPNRHLPGTKGELAVPIKFRDQVLGILDVQSDQVGRLNEEDRLLLESLCGQIAIAIESKQTEEALTHEQYLMNALMNNLPDAIYFKDKHSRFIRISQSQSMRFGFSDPAQAIGKSDFDFFTEEHARPAYEDEQQIIQTGQPITKEERETWPDRPDTWVLTTKLPLRDENGQIVGTFGVSKDITDRRLAEEAIREEQRRSQLILETATVPMIISRLSDSKVLYANQALAQIGHINLDELIGGRSVDYFASRDDRNKVAETLQRQGYVSDFETQLRSGDGTLYWALLSARIFNYQNELCVLSTYVDITARKRAEEALQSAHTELAQAMDNVLQFKSAFEHTNVGMAIVTTDGRFMSVNQALCDLVGYTREELQRKRFGELTHPDDVSFSLDYLRRALAGEIDSFRAEKRYLHRNGEVIWIELSTSILRDAKRQPLYFISQIQDIRQRKQVEGVIRANETQLSEALQIAKLAHWEYDVEHDLFMFNDQFYAIFHTTAEREGGYRLSSAQYAQRFVHPDDLAIVGTEIEKALNSTDRHYNRQLEHRILYADGGVGHISVSVNIDRDEQGRILRYYGANQDITERKQAEQTIREEQQRTQTILETITIPMLISRLSDSKVLYANQALAEFRHMDLDQLMGSRTTDYFVDPNDRNKLVEVLRRQGYATDFETQLRGSSGEASWVLLSARIINFQNETCVLSTYVDITERKQIEQTMAEAQSRAQTILESVTAPIVISRLSDGLIQYTNQQLSDLIRVPLGNLLNNQTPNFYHDAADRQAVIGRIHSHGHVSNYELRLRRGDGTLLWALLSARLFTFQGEPAIITTLFDITERRQAEEALRRSEAELSEALHIAKLAYWEYDVEKDVFLFNDQFYSIFHTTAEQAGGYQLSSAQYAQRFVHPDDLAIVGPEIEKALTSPDRHYSRWLEHRILYADGGIGHVSVNVNVDRDEQGRILRYYGANQDITERRKAEAKLQELFNSVQQSEQLMRTVIDSTPDWIFIKDQEHRYRLVNQGYATALHMRPGDFIGKNDLDLGFPEELVKGNPDRGIRGFWADDQLVMDSGETQVYANDPATVDGVVHIFNTIKTPLRDTDGKIGGVLAFSRDITERERLMAEQQKRTIQLQTAAEVSRASSSILNLEELLPQVVDLVRDRFNFYYVGIFLTDDLQQWAILRAGTGKAGRQMLVNDHKLRIGGMSMISQCIVSQQARIALDVGAEAVRFDNPLLPLTRSEMALPLISRGRVIGAVTIQSEQPGAFSQEDVTVLQSMADQISNAVENARLYEQTRAALAEVDTINRRLTGEAWESYLHRQLGEDVICVTDDSQAAPEVLLQVDDQLSAGAVTLELDQERQGEAIATAPILLRGQPIGALRMRTPVDDWDEDLQAVLTDMAGHVAQAVENARLVEQTQRTASRERTINEINARVRQTIDLDTILQTAVNELGQTLRAARVVARVGITTAEDQTPASGNSRGERNG